MCSGVGLPSGSAAPQSRRYIFLIPLMGGWSMATLRSSWCSVLVSALLIPAGGALARGPAVQHDDDKDDGKGEHHYKDTGEHPSKGDRLGVVVESRALLDKNGTTDFELTTGKLDSTAAAPGNVDALHLELVQPAGDGEASGNYDYQTEFEREYKHLRGAGYVHYSYPGLARNRTLAVEAKLSGFGKGREKVEIELKDVIK